MTVTRVAVKISRIVQSPLLPPRRRTWDLIHWARPPKLADQTSSTLMTKVVICQRLGVSVHPNCPVETKTDLRWPVVGIVLRSCYTYFKWQCCFMASVRLNEIPIKFTTTVLEIIDCFTRAFQIWKQRKPDWLTKIRQKSALAGPECGWITQNQIRGRRLGGGLTKPDWQVHSNRVARLSLSWSVV